MAGSNCTHTHTHTHIHTHTHTPTSKRGKSSFTATCMSMDVVPSSIVATISATEDQTSNNVSKYGCTDVLV